MSSAEALRPLGFSCLVVGVLSAVGRVKGRKTVGTVSSGSMELISIVWRGQVRALLSVVVVVVALKALL